MSEWKGEERRDNERDHDVLTRIDANLSNFMKRFEEHAADDEKNFQNLFDRMGKIERIVWMAIGGGTLLVGVMRFVVK